MKTSNEEFKQLIADYRNGEKECLELIVQKSIGMVKHMSYKYKGLADSFYIPIEDLEQECYIGLLGAIDHFPIDGDSFISFAFSAMTNQMLTYIKYNTHRIVKKDKDSGNAQFESMDKELTSFGELEDVSQEDEFRAIEADIDREYQRQEIDRMLNDILCKDSNVELLKDMYGLNGQGYSLNGICQKYGITIKDLIFKERLMVLKIRNSPKLENYLEKIDYNCSIAYKYGVQRFKDTGMSSTEFLALKHIQAEQDNIRLVTNVLKNPVKSTLGQYDAIKNGCCL